MNQFEVERSTMVVLGGLIAIIVALLVIVSFGMDGRMLKDVQSGKTTLECDFKDGSRIIDPSKVTGYIGDEGHWTFTNGGASSCRVYR